MQQANTALRDKTLEAAQLEEKLEKCEADLKDKLQEIGQLEEQLSGGKTIFYFIFGVSVLSIPIISIAFYSQCSILGLSTFAGAKLMAFY